MLKYFASVACLMLPRSGAGGRCSASGQLSFQGKALAQITRAVSVPFGMVVEETLVSVGTVVEKNTPCCATPCCRRMPRTYQALLSGKESALLPRGNNWPPLSRKVSAPATTGSEIDNCRRRGLPHRPKANAAPRPSRRLRPAKRNYRRNSGP